MAIAYGFVDLEHLFGTRVEQAGVNRVMTAIQESAAEHTRQLNSLMASFVERTVVAQEEYDLPGGGTLQPLDQWGVPLPVKPSGSYQTAYPILGGGTAWGVNRVTMALATVAETNKWMVDAQQKDTNWLRRHIMAALFTNVAWTFKDEVGPNGGKGLGDITIRTLANADTVEYVKVGGDLATDTHFLAQAAGIADATNPYTTLRAELLEHPSNGGENGDIISYIPTNLVATTQALANFVEVDDPDIERGANSDRLTSVIGRSFGDRVIGKVDRHWIVEWSAMPDSYIISHATAGGPVLKMREYPSPALQGFFQEVFEPQSGRKQTSLLRYAGFGVANRVAAAVMRVGNGTYAIPTGYQAPLRV